MDLRTTYLNAARLVVDLVALPEVVSAWDQASVLPKMTVGELAAHLSRSVLQVESFLDEPDPEWAEPISAGSYYALLRQTADVDSSLNQGVRHRAVEVAVHGPAGVRELIAGCLARLTPRLPNEGSQRQVMAYGGRALTLDEYLRTRLVEICVHHDDLVLSLPAATVIAQPSAEAVAIAVDVLVAAARERNGDHATLAALTRRERDLIEALRVL